MYLTFVPNYWEEVKDETSLERAGTKIVKQNIGRVPEAHRTSPEAAARCLLFIEHALEAEGMYAEYVLVACPRVRRLRFGGKHRATADRERAEQGRSAHRERDEGLQHLVPVLAARHLFRRVPKVNMTAGFEERVFDGGPKSELVPVETALGRVGTLGLLRRLPRVAGRALRRARRRDLAQAIVQPACMGRPEHLRPGEQGGRELAPNGCASIIQGRENIRYGVNAMLVGAVFEDMLAEGLSSVAVNTGRSRALVGKRAFSPSRHARTRRRSSPRRLTRREQAPSARPTLR